MKSYYDDVQISENELNSILNAYKRVKVSKNDIIIKDGKLSKNAYFVELGLFRSFVVDFNGNDVTTNFYGRGEVLIDVNSLFLGNPSEERIVALSDGIIWEININSILTLQNSVEAWRNRSREWLALEYYTLKKRSVDMIIKDASIRYQNLVEERPEITKNVPLKYIASFLGITDTSLSRIRRKLNEEK